MQDEKFKKQILMMTLGKIIKKHRLESKKSLSLLSNEVGLAKSTWCDLENGKHKNIYFTNLWKISESLDVPLQQIITELKEILGEDFSIADLK